MTSSSSNAADHDPLGFWVKVVGVKTAFLNGELKEDIYMECLPRMRAVGNDDCLILGKCIFCLVKAMRQYNKALKKVGFNEGSNGP